jgi:hypothetical protein
MAVGADRIQSIGMDDDSENDGPRESTCQLDGSKSYDYSDSYPAIERVLKQMRARLQIAPISGSIPSTGIFVDAMTATHPNLYTQSITPSAKDVTISSLDVSLTDTDDLSDQMQTSDYKAFKSNAHSSGVRTVNDQILSVKDTLLEDTTIGSNLALHKRDESVENISAIAPKSRDEEIAHIRKLALNVECLRKRKVFIAKHLASLSLNRPPLCPSRSLDTLSRPS